MSSLSMIDLCTGDPEFVQRWNDGCRQSHRDELEWIEKLRSLGVKAAHPDDGWVNRERDSVHFCYPQFNDGVSEGDLIALGWHFDKARIVKVVRVDKMGSLTSRDSWTDYYFKPYNP